MNKNHEFLFCEQLNQGHAIIILTQQHSVCVQHVIKTRKKAPDDMEKVIHIISYEGLQIINFYNTTRFFYFHMCLNVDDERRNIETWNVTKSLTHSAAPIYPLIVVNLYAAYQKNTFSFMNISSLSSLTHS